MTFFYKRHIILLLIYIFIVFINNETKKLIYMEGLTMGRVYNFSAGPAVLPEEVLKEAALKLYTLPIVKPSI